MAQDGALCKGHQCVAGQGQAEQSPAWGQLGAGAAGQGLWLLSVPQEAKYSVKNPGTQVSTHQEPDHLFLKTGYYSSLLLENTHAAAHRPRSQTEEKEERKQGKKDSST